MPEQESVHILLIQDLFCEQSALIMHSDLQVGKVNLHVWIGESKPHDHLHF